MLRTRPGRRALWMVVVATLTLAAPGAVPAFAYGGHPEVVATDKGAVRGSTDADGRTFRRIPYAAPPVGDLRWRAPRPAPAWSGVRDATAKGPACAQEQFAPLRQPRVTNEDCLYLDVYTPPAPVTHRPVMVYLHGGAYANGTGSEFDGSALARHGAVVVTVDFRMGVFGFLGLPGLSGEDPQAKSGDYGLLDEEAALRWVRRNAAAFGGDPGRVTVFGQSSGGESVCSLLTSPPAAGLFARAIIQSGQCVLVTSTLPQAETVGTAFATKTGCTAQADVVACLRAKTPAELLDGVAATPELAGPNQVWSPAVGTPTLPTAPAAAIAAGTYSRVKVLIGTVLDEGTILTAIATYGLTVDENLYHVMMAGWFGADVPAVEAQYPLAGYGGNYGATLSAILGDWLASCPDDGFKRSLAKTTRTYAYEFADRTAPNLYPLTPGFPLGAYHASELVYLAPQPILPLNADQTGLSEQILSYWVTFAATGNPNNASAPKWTRFTADHPVVQTLDIGRTRGGTGFATRHHCGFWAGLTG